ncbi:type I restriction endonuclease [Deinococcus depolymerans]|uniref:type I site-specific deoxyribonuclease n=1 Tax=Deinococcus depolymerans TaxID=392408 RepID=A0ABN1CR80_9DEIO
MSFSERHLTDRVYEFLQALGYRALGNRPSAELIDRVTSDRLIALNPHLSEQQRREALELFRRRTLSFAEREWGHTALLHGIRVDPEDKPAFTAQLLTFDALDDNIFQVARDVAVGNAIIDIGLYINGVLVGLIECTKDLRPGESNGVLERLNRLGQQGGAGQTTAQLVAALSPSDAIYGGLGAPPSTYRRFPTAYPSEADFRHAYQAAPTLHGEFLYSLFAPVNLLEILYFLTDVDSQGTSVVAGPFQRIAVHQALEYFNLTLKGNRPLPGILYEHPSDRPPAALLLQPIQTGRLATIAWIAHALQLQPSTRTLGLIIVTDMRVLAEQMHQVLRARLKSDVLLAFTSKEFQSCVKQGRGAVIVTAAHSLRNWTEVPGPTERGWMVIVDQLSPPTSRLLDTLDVLFHRPIVLASGASAPTARSEGNFFVFEQAMDIPVLLSEFSVPLVVKTPQQLSAKRALATAELFENSFSESRQNRTPQNLALEARRRIMSVTLDEHRLQAVAQDIAKHWQALLGPTRKKALVIVHNWEAAQYLSHYLESNLGSETVAVAGTQFEEDQSRQNRRPVGSFGAGILRGQIREFQQDGPPYLWVSTHVPAATDLSISAVYLDKKVNRTELLKLLGPLTRKQPEKAAAYLVDYWGNLAEEDNLAQELMLPILMEEEALVQLERVASRARQVLSLSPLLAQASAQDPTQRNADAQLLQDFTAALNLVGAPFAPPAVRQLHTDFEEHLEKLYQPAAAEETPEITVPHTHPEVIIRDFDFDFDLAPLFAVPIEAEDPDESPLGRDLRSSFQQRWDRSTLLSLSRDMQQLMADAPYLWWEKPTARRLVRRELRQLLTTSLPDSDEVDVDLPLLLDMLEKHARVQD